MRKDFLKDLVGLKTGNDVAVFCILAFFLFFPALLYPLIVSIIRFSAREHAKYRQNP